MVQVCGISQVHTIIALISLFCPASVKELGVCIIQRQRMWINLQPVYTHSQLDHDNIYHVKEQSVEICMSIEWMLSQWVTFIIYACIIWLISANIQEPPPPSYHNIIGQPTSAPSDVKKDEAGPQQVPGYPIGMGPTQNLSHAQQGYPAHVAYNPQQGCPLQPYSHVSIILSYYIEQTIAVTEIHDCR
jgi:hypothetical protein